MLGEPPPPSFDPALLVRGAQLRRQDVVPRPPDWVRVRHGYWMSAADWAGLLPVQRHAALVHATARCCDDPTGPLFSHAAAAALHGLPRISAWPAMAEALVDGPRVRSSRRLRKHVGAVSDAVEVDGLRVTPPARTVIDIARTSMLADGVAAADFAVRQRLCTAADIADQVDEIAVSAPGRARAALVRDLADPGSQSPGESLSRTQMFLLDLPRPELQHRVHDDLGHVGDADFGWGRVLGEFDGRTKYRVPPGATAEEASRVILAEKQREDRMRRRGHLVARWMWREANDARALLRILGAVGIRPVPGRLWFDLGRPAAG
ncbi:MAG: hypothetical protein ACRCSN_12655 [Dermatophilaceae bacterium]